MWVDLELLPTRKGEEVVRDSFEVPDHWRIPPDGEAFYRDGVEYLVTYTRRRGQRVKLRCRKVRGKGRHQGTLRRRAEVRRRGRAT